MTVNSDRPSKNDEAEAHHQGLEEDDEQKDEHTVSSSSSSSLSLCSQSPSESPIQSNHFSKTPSPPPDSPLHSPFTWIQNYSPKPPSPLAQPNRFFPAEPLTRVQDPQTQDGFVFHTEETHEEASGSGGVGVGSFSRRKLRPNLSSRNWTTTTTTNESGAKRVLLGFRICVCLCCLISFSVMAADKEQGWALDSFYRYKEFRYCLAVNVLGFAYSGIQVYDLVRFFSTRKHVVDHKLRHYFDFLMDQILSYLLMSASSSAATRVDDWQSNWGKDKFPDMALASVVLSFAAFIALACSSIISGFILFTSKSL